jgi:membrane protein implicated in regulation of membrane protease activity
LLGRKGIVTCEVQPSTLKGKVMIDNDTWSATAREVIPVGTRVVVKDSEGVHVIVEVRGERPVGGDPISEQGAVNGNRI